MLHYRLPHQREVIRYGQFMTIPEMVQEGFVISDFSQNKLAVFREGTNQEWHFSNQLPFSISKEEYLVAASKLIQTIQQMGLHKVVYSRVLTIDFDHLKSIHLYEKLKQKYPEAFVYALSDPTFGTWVGATPELLLRHVKNHGFTVSLAGTKKASDSSEWGKKEILEQRFVSDFIEDTLTECKIKQVDKGKVYTHEAGPVKHLKTDFSFELGTQQRKELLQKLHPTPAVSGLPRPWSYEVIGLSEKHERSLYAGYLGILEAQEAHVFVNLRCCQITKGKIHLYLGGGFTKDSDPELEWQETQHKSRTILDIVEQL
jgi:isochorismate synthase